MEADDLPDRKRPAHFPAAERHNRAIIYFVTVCTKDRRPMLGGEETHRVLRLAWEAAGDFLVGRYVVMPDHVHLFCSPAGFPPESLSRWMSYWKSLAARKWPDGDGGKLWQRDYWDTQLRQGERYGAKWEYVRQNPVRAGLCREPEEWPYQGEMNRLEWHE